MSDSINCALYIDHLSLSLYLSRRSVFSVELGAVAESLLNAAGVVGNVKIARAFADWARLEGANSFESFGIQAKFTHPKHRTSAGDIKDDVFQWLDKDDTIQTVILVANDISYWSLINQLQSRGKKVVLWGGKDSVDIKLLDKVDEFIEIDEILLLDVKPTELDMPRSMILNAVCLALDDLMALRGITEIPLQVCLDYIKDNLHIFKDTNCFNQAHAENLIILTSAPYDSEIVLYSLNERSPRVQTVLEIRNRLLLTLDSALRGRHWISFNHLERMLRSQAIFGLDEKTRRNWIELLISENLILAQQRKNPDRPDLPPTTALIVNHDHALVEEIPLLVQQQLYRLIILVDGFLTNRNYNWIAASTLMKILKGYLSPVAAQNVFSFARDENVISIIKLNNIKDSLYQVSAIHLNYENDDVKKALKYRNLYLNEIAVAFENRGNGLSHSGLYSYLSKNIPGEVQPSIQFWVDVFVRGNILTRLKKHGGKNPMYMFNRSLPVVAMVLAMNQLRDL